MNSTRKQARPEAPGYDNRFFFFCSHDAATHAFSKLISLAVCADTDSCKTFRHEPPPLPPILPPFSSRRPKKALISSQYLSPGVWVGAAAEALRDALPQLQPVVRQRRGQVLRVRVAHHELHALEVARDHIAHFFAVGTREEGREGGGEGALVGQRRGESSTKNKKKNRADVQGIHTLRMPNSCTAGLLTAGLRAITKNESPELILRAVQPVLYVGVTNRTMSHKKNTFGRREPNTLPTPEQKPHATLTFQSSHCTDATLASHLRSPLPHHSRQP